MDPGRAPQTAAAGLIPGWSAGTYIYTHMVEYCIPQTAAAWLIPGWSVVSRDLYICTHMVEYTTDSSSRADTMQAGQQGPIYIYIHTW